MQKNCCAIPQRGEEKMKKTLACLLCSLLLLPLFAQAEETEGPETLVSGGYKYILLEDGTAEITGYSGDAESLTVPAEIDGHSVTGIGDGAFSWCSNLTEITIPDSVVKIGANPFAYCENLSVISVSPDHPTLAVIDGALFEKAEKRLVSYFGEIDRQAYEIPQEIRIIGDYTFSGRKNLTIISIPDSVTSIGDYTFLGCNSLTLTVTRNSYAAKYCKENNLAYTYTDSLDWLND